MPRSLWSTASLLLVFFCVSLLVSVTAFPFPSSGYATLTHYDLPLDYVASCGCVGRSTYYPTAALNTAAYGSNYSFGSACGTCFELRLVNTPLSPPPPPADDPTAPWGDGIVYTDQQVQDGSTPSVVVRIIDACPGGPPWCNSTIETVNLPPPPPLPSLANATSTTNGTSPTASAPTTAAEPSTTTLMKGNSLGSMVHFDLAWPSRGIPSSFFPGDHDYGVWNVSYRAVSCDRWKGAGDRAALGSDWDQQDAACCPLNPAPSGADATCPPYYDTRPPMLAAVPNTSNPLSKGRSVGSNAATAQNSASWWATFAMPPLVVSISLAVGGGAAAAW